MFNFKQNRKEYGKAKGNFNPQLRPLRTPSPVRHASSRPPAFIDGAHAASSPVPAPTTPPALLNSSSNSNGGMTPASCSLMKKLDQVVDPAGLIIWAMPVGLANWYMLGGEGSLTRALTSHPSSIVAQVSTLPVSTLASQCHGYLAPGQAST